jgi:hypothetical protein
MEWALSCFFQYFTNRLNKEIERKDLSVKSESIKSLEDNIRESFLNIGLSNDLLHRISKNKSNERKNKQLELYQTNKLLHSNGNKQQNEKTA